MNILKIAILEIVEDFSIGLREINEKIQNKHDLKIFKIIWMMIKKQQIIIIL